MANQTKRNIRDALNDYAQARARRREVFGPDLVDTLGDVTAIAVDETIERGRRVGRRAKNVAIDVVSSSKDIYDRSKETIHTKLQGVKDTIKNQTASFYATLDARQVVREQRRADRKEFMQNMFKRTAKFADKVVGAVGKTYQGGKELGRRMQQEMRRGSGFLAASLVGLSEMAQNKVRQWHQERLANGGKTLKERLADRFEHMADTLRGSEPLVLDTKLDFVSRDTVKEALGAQYLALDKDGRREFRKTIAKSNSIVDVEYDGKKLEFGYPRREMREFTRDLDAYSKYRDTLRDIDQKMSEVEQKYPFMNPGITTEAYDAQVVSGENNNGMDQRAESNLGAYTNHENNVAASLGDIESNQTAQVQGNQMADVNNPEVRFAMIAELEHRADILNDSLRNNHMKNIDQKEAHFEEMYDVLAEYAVRADDNHLLKQIDDITPGYLRISGDLTEDRVDAIKNTIELLERDRDQSIEAGMSNAATQHRALTMFRNSLKNYEAEHNIMAGNEQASTIDKGVEFDNPVIGNVSDLDWDEPGNVVEFAPQDIDDFHQSLLSMEPAPEPAYETAAQLSNDDFANLTQEAPAMSM